MLDKLNVFLPSGVVVTVFPTVPCAEDSLDVGRMVVPQTRGEELLVHLEDPVHPGPTLDAANQLLELHDGFSVRQDLACHSSE